MSVSTASARTRRMPPETHRESESDAPEGGNRLFICLSEGMIAGVSGKNSDVAIVKSDRERKGRPSSKTSLKRTSKKIMDI